MSFPTNEQYERIARYLDGEPISLTGQEAAFARDLREQEFALAEALPVAVEPELLPRVRRGIARRLRLARHPVRRGLWATAAAAAFVAAFMTHYWSGEPIAPASPRSGRALLSSLAPTPAQPNASPVDARVYEDQVAAIGMELDRDLSDLETDTVLSRTPASPSEGPGVAGEGLDLHTAPAADPTRS